MTIIEEARALAGAADTLAELMQGTPAHGAGGTARALLPQLAAALRTLATELEPRTLDARAEAAPAEPTPLWWEAAGRVKEMRLLRRILMEYRTMGRWDHPVAVSARERMEQLQDELEEIA